MSMEIRMFMYDMARGRCYRKSFLITLLDFLHKLGYNQLLLYLEGAYQFDFLPVPWRHGLLSPNDAAELSKECGKRGIEIVPATNIYYHTEHFLDLERFQDIRDFKIKQGGQKQVDPLNPDTRKLFQAVIEQLSRDFKTSKIHIGGDEVITAPSVNSETKKKLDEYLPSLCRWTLNKGLVPCIWGDTIYKYQELINAFPKETVIYDWYYGGHRKESTMFFIRAGYKTIACTSDNSWWAPFNVQSNENDYLKPGEIEPFINDAREAGATGAGITVWGLYYGTPFLPNLYPIARAALAMKAILPSGEKNIDKAVHAALFGKEDNPLVSLSRLIYDELYNHPVQTLRDSFNSSVQITFAACRAESLRYLLLADEEDISSVIQEAMRRTAEKMEPYMIQWNEDDSFCRNCKVGFSAIKERFLFGNLALDLGRKGRRLYHEASLIQYSDPSRARDLIEQICLKIENMQSILYRLSGLLDILVSEEGQSPLDSAMVRERASDLKNLSRELRERLGSLPPLPSWNGLINILLPNSHPGYWLPA